jgi:8-oxo-dGTP pyrophosphatase MutT (NUDIX family)
MARPRVVATTWLHRDGDLIFAVLSHRSPLWFLPGGQPEPGESLVQATAREVLEEIGVSVDPALLREVIRVRDDAAAASDSPGVEVELVGHVEEGGRPPLDPIALTLAADEIDEARWVGPGDGDLLAPAVRRVVEALAAVGVPDADCWLHPSVEVRESPIEGRGLFATSVLTAGTVVARLGGRLVDTGVMRELVADATAHLSAYVDTITVLEDLHLVLPPRRPVGYGNHSCDPTLWHTDAFTLAARRDLGLGDELTVDYATQTAEAAFELACRCGSTRCRGRVTGADWRRPELQERYGEHWVPALLARIR